MNSPYRERGLVLQDVQVRPRKMSSTGDSGCVPTLILLAAYGFIFWSIWTMDDGPLDKHYQHVGEGNL